MLRIGRTIPDAIFHPLGEEFGPVCYVGRINKMTLSECPYELLGSETLLWHSPQPECPRFIAIGQVSLAPNGSCPVAGWKLRQAATQGSLDQALTSRNYQ